MNESSYRDFLRLTSAITRVVGIAGFVGVIIFWGFTKQFEPVILGGCITLTGIGQGLDVVKEIAETRSDLRRLGAEVPPPVAPLPLSPAVDPVVVVSPPPSAGTGGA